MLADLLELTASLVKIPSVSGQERAMADRVEAELTGAPWLTVVRLGDALVARSDQGLASRVVLAGHLDTVPPTALAPSGIDNDTCRGLGAVDMKGGIAVMMALALESPPSICDVTFVFYPFEEVDRSKNGLRHVAEARPELIGGDAAVVCEPTAAVVEAGCQGSIRVEVTVTGQRAHTARPWMGVNAIHRLADVLTIVNGYPGREVSIDGCGFRESLQAVSISGGVAGNVVPDSATIVLNGRFAPDRDVESAVEGMRTLLGSVVDEAAGDTVTVVDATGGARPHLDHPVLRRLVDLSGAPPRAKLGLTDVSLFADLGIPATNFGPGDSTLAHTPREIVTRGELEATFGALAALVGVGAR